MAGKRGYVVEASPNPQGKGMLDMMREGRGWDVGRRTGATAVTKRES